MDELASFEPAIRAIAAHHGLSLPRVFPAPWTGATCRVFPLDDVVVRIPFDRPDAVQSLVTDALMAPVGRSLGVATPEVLVLDRSGAVVPAPYAITRRVMGVPASDLDLDPGKQEAVWRQVGEHLARIHAVPSPAAIDLPLTLRHFVQTSEVDPRPWAVELADLGVLPADDARWLSALLGALAGTVLTSDANTLCHGDINAANVLVAPESRQFLAMIDWAGAGWLDPVWDFAGVPLAVVPAMLAGHRAVAPLPDDASAEARIAWVRLQARLHGARTGNASREQLLASLRQVREWCRTLGIT